MTQMAWEDRRYLGKYRASPLWQREKEERTDAPHRREHVC
jgi:hypothetical protein